MKILSSILVLALVGTSFAQFTAPKELDVFKWTLGEWKGTVKFSEQLGGTEAKMTFKNYMDGKFLRADSVMEQMGMKFIESSYLGYDSIKKEYKSWTFTNWADMPRIEKVTVEEGKSMVFISEPWFAMGMSVTTRGRMSPVGENGMKFTLESKVGDTWQPMGEGTFERVKGSK